ncbi:MAG: hypothetical protein Q4F00_02110 [bacterium]|nr:hypothetical protein [bacterium]
MHSFLHYYAGDYFIDQHDRICHYQSDLIYPIIDTQEAYEQLLDSIAYVQNQLDRLEHSDQWHDDEILYFSRIAHLLELPHEKFADALMLRDKALEFIDDLIDDDSTTRKFELELLKLQSLLNDNLANQRLYEFYHYSSLANPQDAIKADYYKTLCDCEFSPDDHPCYCPSTQPRTHVRRPTRSAKSARPKSSRKKGSNSRKSNSKRTRKR